jgi:hypothetical protein
VPCCTGCNQGSQRRRRRAAAARAAAQAASSGPDGVQPLDALPLPVATRPTQHGSPRGGNSGGVAVPCAALKAGEALALPLDATRVVTRVFLGVGWRAKAANASQGDAQGNGSGPIDVDCCAAPYAQV